MVKRRTKKKAVRKRARRKPATTDVGVDGGLKVYRSGLESGEWRLVDSDPTVLHSFDHVSLGANIAVDKSALKQSVVSITISDESLAALFEEHFGVSGKSVGVLALESKRSKEITSALLDVLDNLKQGDFWFVKYILQDIPEDPSYFVEPNDVARLKAIKKHKWDKD